MAGAGTGKTRTLVERCLDCLAPDGAGIDDLLIVTFTEAAAAEMRDRLRRAIDERFTASADVFWAGQLARFDLGHIGTLHSFCLKLVREHFHELGLDPRLTLLDEGQSRQLATEILDAQLDAHYAGDDEFSLAVRDLIQTHGGGRDDSIRHLVVRLHAYAQSRPDADGWLAGQRGHFSAAGLGLWQSWLRDALAGWRAESLPVLESLAKAGNDKAAELAPLVSGLVAEGETWRAHAAAGLEQITAADGDWPKRRKTILRKPLEKLFDGAQFLLALMKVENGRDPLAEDWSWVRTPMDTLLRLTEEFAAKLDERKRAGAVLDFHDLEQFALRLLWDFKSGQPTAIAAQWRARLKFVFVDEYQDINAAQDQIIRALSRDGTAGSGDRPNRFLVGDVKQSIYRFRLADPQIFRQYAHDWHGAAGQVIPLAENFRSHPRLLGFINSLFRLVMRAEIGGVAYDANAELRAGRVEVPQTANAAAVPPRVELLVRFKTGRAGSAEAEADDLIIGNDVQCEARLLAQHIKQMMAAGYRIPDGAAQTSRPLAWRDIAILLRSPRARADIFAREFELAGIPLAVARGGFYESAEVLDLLSLLQLLDNPLQDIPCLAVVRSPLVGLSVNELAKIRLAAREKHFWTALGRFHETGKSPDGAADPTHEKVSRFLDQFSRWRQRARLVSLSQCLEEILAETLYADWRAAQPRGAQRSANLNAFLQLARRFDEYQRQGLYRFLKFIEAQQEAEAEPEVPPVIAENAVRLMSIHQSKGLEFPVVVLADLAKPFNESDLRAEIIFDEAFGLCPKVKPPHAAGRYASLPHWLAQRRQRMELRGEELRLFYVAVTRAREHLILAASVPEKQWREAWQTPPTAGSDLAAIARARSFADWLALWFARQPQAPPGETRGQNEFMAWQVVPTPSPAAAPAPEPVAPAAGTVAPITSAEDVAAVRHLRARLEWVYPFAASTQFAAKSSVTALRREAEDNDDEAAPLFPRAVPASNASTPSSPRRRGVALSAAAIGAAHHKFLQHVDLERAADPAAEAERLVREGYLDAEEHAALDLRALASFWESPLGRKIRAVPGNVRRELPFTARFRPAELSAVTGRPVSPEVAEEFVIVQGVADLVVLLPRETWLVDFKTDDLLPLELPEKIRAYTPQVQLYALALERIFGPPVTVKALRFLALDHTALID